MYRIIEVKPGRYSVLVRTNNWIFNRWWYERSMFGGVYLETNLDSAHDAGKRWEEHYIKMRALPRQVYHSVADRPERCHCPDCTIHNNKPGAVRPFIG